MTFEEYLVSKKIEPGLFKDAEPKLFQEWKNEFGQVHPNSFTAQKLYLINPIRRKYVLKQEMKTVVVADDRVKAEEKIIGEQAKTAGSNENSNQLEQKPESLPDNKPAPSPGVKPARPVFKPKPKMN